VLLLQAWAESRRAFEAFLEAAGLASAILVGVSSGGCVAQQVAVTHAERVAGLVIVGAPLNLHGRPPFAAEVGLLVDPVQERGSGTP
jgi:pimeloyl-ACP methyl ester carboxylesterase